MIYVGAIVNDDGDPVPDEVWARPLTVIAMSDEAMSLTAVEERRAWADAESSAVRAIVKLLDEQGIEYNPWYAINSRETLRDETWPKWQSYGATRRREGLPTSSPRPRWALTASFAALFDPQLVDAALDAAIDDWRATHMSPGDRLKIQRASTLAKSQHQVVVQIPGVGVRNLEPGVTSAILKGVIEEWAPRRLADPVVIAISEPGAKVWVLDAQTMAAAGISVNVSSVLPDAIIIDAGASPVRFWIVEAVASDGEINESRRADLLSWAADQYIDPKHCDFLSAFPSRGSAPARKRLRDIAVGTYCWFLDEPDRELAWNELPDRA
jgi:hypothetical protein